MLKLTNVQQNFGDTIISYPDWVLSKGSHALILGDSGSGKTTLLHLLAGLLKPTAGLLELNGSEISKLSTRKLDRFRGENVGIIFQKPHLLKSLTVIENIRLGGKFSRKSISDDRAGSVLDQLGLEKLGNRYVHQLSEGQAQRVSIARAVIHEPAILLADEPTASLDDANCNKVVELLINQANQCGSTLIIATHDQRVKARFDNFLEL